MLFECKRFNINVFKQIAVTGFHGHDVGQVVTPKLASILTPRIAIGQKSAEMLIRSINGETITQM